LQSSPEMPMRKLVWKDVVLINQLAEKYGYNRQIDTDALKRDVMEKVKAMGHKNFERVYFAAKEFILHEHKAGKKCEPHMRIGVWFPDNIHVIMDCDLHLWNSFERIIPQPHERPVLSLVN
jgi:hypothetical protein